MTSVFLRPRVAPVKTRSRTRLLAPALVVLGAVLLLIGLAQNVADRPTQASVGDTATPSIQVRTRFSGITPGGQTTGFAVAPDGSLAYVDRGRQRVIRLDANGGPLAEWGPRFDADADAQDLNGIAAVGTDWYVLDRGRGRILHLDASGRATRTIDLQSLGTYGPNGLAADARGNVYLADTGGNRILVFSATGATVRTIGTAGAELGQLKQPMGLSFGPDGAMYVTDFENNRLERWDDTLQATNAWALTGHSWGVAVDRLNRVFVPDADHNVVRMYSPRGDLLAEIGGRPDSTLGVGTPTQAGLTPDGSALWVLGSDGLARVDLSVYSALVPATGSRGASFPFFPVGGLFIVLGLAPLAFRTLTRRPAAAVPTPERIEPSLSPNGAPPTRDTIGKNRRAFAVGMALFILGLVGVCWTQLSLVGPTGKNDPWPRLALLLVGGVVWAAGCRISARALPLRWVAEWPVCRPSSTGGGLSSRQILLAAAALALGVIAAGTWWVGRFETPDATRGMLFWLGALVLAGLACAGGAIRVPRMSRMALIPVALFVLALVPRLWQAADLPYGLWFDEAQGALEVRRVFHQGTYTPILNTYGKDTSGFFYIISALSLFLGDNILAARAAAAVVGALTVPVTYLLGRELFGWRVGLAAGLLLAFMRWHVNFSRLGFNPISLPLCATLAFWLLARAVRRRQWSDVAWAGLALGVGLHAYTGFRGMPVVALVVLALAALLYRWPRWSLAPRFGLYLGGMVLTALPVLVFAIQDPVTVNGRTAQTLILTQQVSDAEKLRQIWDTVQRHALMFNVNGGGDLNGRHNLPGAPMLDPLTGALVALGLGWLLIRPRDWRTLMLLAWSAVSMSGGILTLAFEAPQGVRTFGITPVLAVLGGIGLLASLDRLLGLVTLPRRVRARRAGIAMVGVGALAVAWTGWSNLDTYFNRQMRDADVFSSFSTRETVPAKAALEGGGRYASILTSTTMSPTVEGSFIVPDLQATIRPFDWAGDMPNRGPGPNLVFLETEHDQALADEFARMYPDAVRRPVRPPAGGKPIVEGFQLEPDVLAAHRGVLASYVGPDGTALERTEARPDTASNSPPVALPADVTWRAGLALDATGEYSFRVPAGFELRIDDAPLASAAGSGVRARLVRGNHALQLSGRLAPGAQVGLEWRTPSLSQWQPVSADALFAAPAGGLGLQLTLATGLDSTAPPTEEYIDPVLAHYYHVSPFNRLHLDPRVWAAEWVGELDAPSSGQYGFSLDHSQSVAILVDNRQILGNLNAPSDVRNTIVTLSAGRHALRARFEKSSEGSPWINLLWSPPGAPPAVVPGSALYPPAPVVLGAAQ